MKKLENIRNTFKWYRLRLQVLLLNLNDWLWRRSVIGEEPVTVCLTTHGRRLATVHTSIQSIVAGSVRPSRMILWLNGEPDRPAITKQLKRLQRRGLEIKYVRNYGPHTKYYPYVELLTEHKVSLVTADDDVIYPKGWLKGLLAASKTERGLIHCYWARRVALEAGRVLPYLQWTNVRSIQPSVLNFALGVSGIIYPADFLMVLRAAGDAFMAKCPRADDIWLHVMALRSGYQVKQVGTEHVYPRLVPFTQNDALYLSNHQAGGNDAQIAATYSRDDLDILAKGL